MIENVTGKRVDLQGAQPGPPGGCGMSIGLTFAAALIYTGVGSIIGALIGWALR